MNTYQPKAKDVKRGWHILDAGELVLGRMASEIVALLMGKHKKTYAPHMDMGDYVVVVNAEKVNLTGRKPEQKIYYRHSGYPGGLKETKFSDLINKNPEKVVELAVRRMLPKNRLNKKRMTRLKVFAGSEHPYEDKFAKKDKNK